MEPNLYHFELSYRRADGSIGYAFGSGATAKARDKRAADGIASYASLGWSIISCDCTISCGPCLGSGRIRKGSRNSWKPCKACNGAGIFREPTGAEIEAAKT